MSRSRSTHSIQPSSLRCIHPSIHPSVLPSVRPSVHPSIHPSIDLPLVALIIKAIPATKISQNVWLYHPKSTFGSPQKSIKNDAWGLQNLLKSSCEAMMLQQTRSNLIFFFEFFGFFMDFWTPKCNPNRKKNHYNSKLKNNIFLVAFFNCFFFVLASENEA